MSKENSFRRSATRSLFRSHLVGDLWENVFEEVNSQHNHHHPSIILIHDITIDSITPLRGDKVVLYPCHFPFTIHSTYKTIGLYLMTCIGFVYYDRYRCIIFTTFVAVVVHKSFVHIAR